jgi:hypothetical protein
MDLRSHLNHRYILGSEPAGDLGPMMRLPTLPGPDRLHGDHDVGKPVTDHGLDDAGEIRLGGAEIVQQVQGDPDALTECIFPAV